MSDDLNTNSTPESSNGATMSESTSSTLATDSGTVQSRSDAGTGEQGAPTDKEFDSFTRIDPKTLPPQLRSAYNNMLSDYKQKTTQLSEKVKAEVAKSSEPLKSKADFYDQIIGQEEFVKQWNDYVQKVNTQPQGKESDFQNQGNPELTQLKSELQKISQQLQLSEMSQVTDAFADAVNEKGEMMHPEFDKLNDILIGSTDEGESYSLLRACIELSPSKNPQEKLAHGYKMSKQIYDSIFEEGRKAGLGRIQSKVQNGTQPPTSISGNLAITEKKPKTAREALEMAKKGMMVSR